MYYVLYKTIQHILYIHEYTYECIREYIYANTNIYTYTSIKGTDILVKVSLFTSNIFLTFFLKAINILIENVSVFTITNSVYHFVGSLQWSQHSLPQISEQGMPSVSYVTDHRYPGI